MSYNIALYPTETMQLEQESNEEDFFDHQEHLVPFTEVQVQELRDRLGRYGYLVMGTNRFGTSFNHQSGEGATALLTGTGLHFSASGEGIFEISMTASEFTDTGGFAKWDPQNGGWEEDF